MNIDEIYEKLSVQGLDKKDDSVRTSHGLFNEDDLITVVDSKMNPDFINELYLKIDKPGLEELLNSVLNKISTLPQKDSYNHMIDIFNSLQTEINNYFGTGNTQERISFYLMNGEALNDEARVCNMSQLKGKGVAQCVEKAAVANNILLILKQMNLFDYDVNYLNSNLKLGDRKTEPHAFLEFDRIKNNGEISHLIYDVTNPEIVFSNGEEHFYPAVYSLNDDEYKVFLSGGSFDSSKFIVSEFYQQKESRIYSGFSDNLSYEDSLQALRESYEEMINEPAEYNFESDKGSFSDHMTLPKKDNGIHR